MISKNPDRMQFPDGVIVTAGSTYLDIDAYACCVAMSELLRLQGENAIAYSCAPCNYSICDFLVEDNQIAHTLPAEFHAQTASYVIVDVSDPDYLMDSVPIEQVARVYDHHVGFEDYWHNCIADGAHIEFIGAAATLIYREWEKSGLTEKMTRSTSLLLIAAILDNTLNLTSSNTTAEDIEVFTALCAKENISSDWCASYFSQVQQNIEAELRNALLGDVKCLRDHPVLPEHIGQLCVWDAGTILERMAEIRQWFGQRYSCWMINIIDIKHQCSYFVCDDANCQKGIGEVFDVRFVSDVAKTSIPYLRKEIIKIANKV